MSELTIGCHEITIISPPQPVFIVEKPPTSLNIVLPIGGPPGPPGEDGEDGASGVGDQDIADIISNPLSQTRAALTPVIETRIDIQTDPEIDLSILFDNAKA